MRQLLFLSLVCVGAFVWAQNNQEQEERVCLPPIQGVVSHHFGHGVGHGGYTSGELFLIGASKDNPFSPFLDGRFHVMNDGHFASNAGLGFRYLLLDDQLSVGANAYHDYRSSSHLSTQQIAGGIELLSPYVDFRLNGYLPFKGTKHSRRLKFESFSGNQINVRQTTYTSLPSTNAEIGIPTPMIPVIKTDFYFGIGPYYLFGTRVSGNRCPSSWGGKFRALANITEYVTLEFELNHDQVFDTTYQGIASINIPLWKNRRCRSGNPGYGKRAFYTRTLRPVMRNEIIPVKRKSEVRPLKDESGLIIPVFFVNNLVACPGLGTFEFPFCSFASIPSYPALIYTFQGTGTSTPNYDSGFVMSQGQILQGSGTSFTISGAEVPALTAGNPVLSNNAGPAVTLASNTTVRGITFEGSPGQVSVFGTGLSNVTIENNIFNNSDTGIEILNHQGTLTITQNTFNEYSFRAIGVLLDNPNAVALISQNTLISTAAPANLRDLQVTVTQGRSIIASNQITSQYFFNIQGFNGYQIISGNTIFNPSTNFVEGINYISTMTSQPSNQVYITNNQITMPNVALTSVGIYTRANGAPYFAQIHDNNVTTVSNVGIKAEALTAHPTCATIRGNTTRSYELVGFAGGPINVQETQAQYNALNTTITGFTEFPPVNFGSSCTAP
ncbi:MAG: inverse autotransporter beta domain-containing protein [Chlamydiia bacterium]|nr:inverse autotransporter beta domain-containing protein [Chlamydiia bacterium]